MVLEAMTNIFIDQHDPDKGVLKFPQEIKSGLRDENSEFTNFVHAIFENTAVLSDQLLATLWNHPAVSRPHARHYIANRPAIMPPEIVDQVYQQGEDSESVLTSLFEHQPDQPAERLREAYNQHGKRTFSDEDFHRALYKQANLPEDIRQEIRSKLGIEAELGRAVLQSAG